MKSKEADEKTEDERVIEGFKKSIEVSVNNLRTKAWLKVKQDLYHAVMLLNAVLHEMVEDAVSVELVPRDKKPNTLEIAQSENRLRPEDTLLALKVVTKNRPSLAVAMFAVGEAYPCLLGVVTPPQELGKMKGLPKFTGMLPDPRSIHGALISVFLDSAFSPMEPFALKELSDALPKESDKDDSRS